MQCPSREHIHRRRKPLQQALLPFEIVAMFSAAGLHADPDLIAAGQLCHTRDQLQHGMHLT